MSTPPATIAATVNRPPSVYTYQLARFTRGKARSLAPIMSGIRKLPNTAGIDGIRKKKIITIPCVVNTRL